MSLPTARPRYVRTVAIHGRILERSLWVVRVVLRERRHVECRVLARAPSVAKVASNLEGTIEIIRARLVIVRRRDRAGGRVHDRDSGVHDVVVLARARFDRGSGVRLDFDGGGGVDVRPRGGCGGERCFSHTAASGRRRRLHRASVRTRRGRQSAAATGRRQGEGQDWERAHDWFECAPATSGCKGVPVTMAFTIAEAVVHAPGEIRYALGGVTFEQALRELGVEQGVAPDQARRAYLRLLKERKPEVDPSGFQRLRAAYELVRLVLEHTSGRDPPGVPVDISPAGARPPREAPAATDESPVPPAEATSSVDRSDAPMAAAPPEDPNVERLKQIDELLAREHWKQAGDALVEHYEAAAVRPVLPAPAPYHTVMALLRLYEEGFVDEAGRLEGVFAAWLKVQGNEIRVLARVWPQWALARELGALATSLSTGGRRAIARAARDLEIDDSMSALRERARVDPLSARRDARLLRARKTPFATVIAAVLAPRRWERRRSKERAERPERNGFTHRAFVWLAGLAVLAFAHSVYVYATSIDSSHGPTERAVEVALHSAATEVKNLSDEGAGEGQANFAAKAQRLREALLAANCRVGRDLASDLTGTAPRPDLREHARSIEARVIAACNVLKSDP